MGSGAKCRGPGHNVWVRREILFAPAHKYFSPMCSMSNGCPSGPSVLLLNLRDHTWIG